MGETGKTQVRQVTYTTGETLIEHGLTSAPTGETGHVQMRQATYR